MNIFLSIIVFALGVSVSAFVLKRSGRTRSAKRHGKMVANAVKHRLSEGSKIVAIGGGTGLSTLLRGLKCFTKNITAVVAVTDEGGSSGRLREEWGMLPPGDIRNCIVALAENDSSLSSLLNYRFDKGQLCGHSLGNIIILAATELMGDFQRAVEELNNMLAIRGRVLPVTTENVKLYGETNDGKSISGELEISENGRILSKLWIEPADASTLPAVCKSIDDADVITMGPGSLFTSVMPNLLLKDIAKKLNETKIPIIYIANLMTQPKETEGMNIVAHVDWLAGVIGRVPDYIFVNQSKIPDDLVKRYSKIGAEPLYLSAREEKYLTSLGTKIVFGDFCEIKDNKYLRHDALHISEKIIEIAKGNSRLYEKS
ncbi:MAG: uridine diphosphate-N-acetylglucosamine-binding protein YvcK [Synergistes sp.]|nr:uridine diphosphate-N-acetylglucosamine-binding protein YvcK [Synergistes sp.]